MARSRPGISRELFDALIASRPDGVRLETKAAFLKLEGPGGQRIYVSRSPVVRQVDLAGFGRDHDGCLNSDGLNGQVQAHLDLSLPEGQVVNTFVALLEQLASFVRTEPARMKRTAPVLPRQDIEHVDVEREMRRDERIERRRQITAEHGLEWEVTEDELTGAHHPDIHVAAEFNVSGQHDEE